MKQSIDKRIGIIGGGQLGQMMILDAKKMGFTVTILDPTFHCPAHSIADEHIVANFDDEESIRALAEKSDVMTYEFEHIGAHVLEKLEQEGMPVYPSAKNLSMIQNKLTQKQLLKEHLVPIPDFLSVETLEDMAQAKTSFGFPFLLKAATGGYDGKGNYFVAEESQMANAYQALGSGRLPLLAERYFPFKMEISVLACRSLAGDIVVYPVAENIHKDNILRETRVPAAISQETTKQAMELAKTVMEIFSGVGMFCTEMFVSENGQVVVNEVAPRPHNSGHYTIEACATSQFEQHIRAITGLPLGSEALLCPVVMQNLLGEDGYQGDAVVSGAETCLRVPRTTLHLYGKEKVSPKRKMGHLTTTGQTLEDALKQGHKAREALRIIGTEKI